MLTCAEFERKITKKIRAKSICNRYTFAEMGVKKIYFSHRAIITQPIFARMREILMPRKHGLGGWPHAANLNIGYLKLQKTHTSETLDKTNMFCRLVILGNNSVSPGTDEWESDVFLMQSRNKIFVFIVCQNSCSIGSLMFKGILIHSLKMR